MSVLGVIINVLGDHVSGMQELAEEIRDALDADGYLNNLDGPMVIELDDRAVTHETELARGVDVLWNNGTPVGIRLCEQFEMRYE